MKILRIEYDHDSKSGWSQFYRLHLEDGHLTEREALWKELNDYCATYDMAWAVYRQGRRQWVLWDQVLETWASRFDFGVSLFDAMRDAKKQQCRRERIEAQMQPIRAARYRRKIRWEQDIVANNSR